MFQPIGPNFLLSWMIAWKKQNPKSNFLYSVGLRQSLNSFYEIPTYDLNKLALKPWGGYIVILTLFCKTEIGNEPVGIDVNHNLKSLWVFSPNYYTIF